jgi:acetyl/propionyl-CoA carboxylase alpha subunit
MPKVRLRSTSLPEPVDAEVLREDQRRPGTLRVVLDGTAHEVEVGGGAGGSWLMLRGRIVPYCAIREGDTVLVWLGGRTYEFSVVRPTPRRAGGSVAAAAAAGTDITAAMPGTVLKVNVQRGDSFAANAALIVMESMKMEMTLAAPFAGTVNEVSCKPGELVEVGRVLARLEPAKRDGNAS